MLDHAKALIELVAGHRVEGEDDGPAKRTRILISATFGSLVFAAIYGVAAGSTDAGLAMANLYKLPMVILLSALSAVPAGLLAWKLVGAPNRASDLLMGLASANLSATLVLAVLAPVVALYYHTSGYLGGVLATCSAGLSLIIGLTMLLRAVRKRLPEGGKLRRAGVPLTVLMVLQLATLLQLISLASPILPEVTVWDGGADALVSQ